MGQRFDEKTCWWCSGELSSKIYFEQGKPDFVFCCVEHLTAWRDRRKERLLASPLRLVNGHRI